MKTIFIAGCFDGLHEGHLHLLREAKKYAPTLIIALNTDEDVARRKGDERPKNKFAERKDALLKTGLVSALYHFSGDLELLDLIEEVKPDFIATGDDYKKEQVIGHQVCEQWNGQIVAIPKLPNISSTKNMIGEVHITGGAGFIGTNLVKLLNKYGVAPIIYDSPAKWKNLLGLDYTLKTIREFEDLSSLDVGDSTCIHLGANVDTGEQMNDQLWYNNVGIAMEAQKKFKRFIYASSAAVYGAEEKDFSERIKGLRPLNAYAYSKWTLDKHFADIKAPVVGLRFFNVYGPGEAHKGKMASVIHQAKNKLVPIYQDKDVRQTFCGIKVEPCQPFWLLFQSHREGIPDGEQRRDFVHVFDVCYVIKFFLENPELMGIYNLGTGTARSFNDVVKAVDRYLPIQYRAMPIEYRDQYQYFTQADISKLRGVGYNKEFLTLEKGVYATDI